MIACAALSDASAAAVTRRHRPRVAPPATGPWGPWVVRCLDQSAEVARAEAVFWHEREDAADRVALAEAEDEERLAALVLDARGAFAAY